MPRTDAQRIGPVTLGGFSIDPPFAEISIPSSRRINGTNKLLLKIYQIFGIMQGKNSFFYEIRKSK